MDWDVECVETEGPLVGQHAVIALPEGSIAFTQRFEPKQKGRFLKISLAAKGPKQFGQTYAKGTCDVYDLTVETEWCSALLVIDHTPRHYHKICREIFFVVDGTLEIEVDGKLHVLERGEAIEVKPLQIHHLRKGQLKPVSVLCFNFPAFDPADMLLADA